MVVVAGVEAVVIVLLTLPLQRVVLAVVDHMQGLEVVLAQSLLPELGLLPRHLRYTRHPGLPFPLGPLKQPIKWCGTIVG
jgi:hypothetical protein